MDTSDLMASNATASNGSPGNQERDRGVERRFYTGISVALFFMVLVGFWPSYFSLVFGEPVDRPMIMHVHGAIFTGWMLLLLQVGLVATGRVAAHRAVGKFGIAYGVIVLLLGSAVTFVAPALHVQSGNWPLDQAEGHKRLMLVATIILAFAAVARMEIQSPLLFFLVWVSPLLVGMAFDLYRRKRVHKVYLVSVVVLAVAFLRTFLVESEVWLAIARPMLTPFL